jgi:peptidoglycan/xylan/chitin deacetylase (PgdA/CDA1 family)
MVTHSGRGLHGYSHEEPNKLSVEQQKEVLNHSFDLITAFAGTPPKGIVTPMYQISAESTQLLLDKGLMYDHSAMHRDCIPYYLRVNDK